MAEKVFAVLLHEEIGEGRGGEEADFPALLTRFERQSRGQMGLAGSDRTHENQVLFRLQEPQAFYGLSAQTAGQFDLRGPRELVQSLDDVESCRLYHAVDPIRLPLPQFQPQQVGDVLLPVLKLYLAPVLRHAAQLQLPHGLLDFRHGRHLLSGCHKP